MSTKGEGGQREGGQWAQVAAAGAAVPGFVLAILSVVALVMAVFGRYPMWPHDELTLAEAAGTREEAEVTRLIEQGQDLDARYTVRSGLVLEREARLTPLEAAVLNDDPVIARQLMARGAALDGDTAMALRCHVTGARVLPVLDEFGPSIRPDCAAVKTPWD